MPEIKLKPCPFCGQPINLIEGNALFGWHKPSCFWHYLDDGKISAMSQEELTSEAIKAWNHRANEENEPLTLKEAVEKQIAKKPVNIFDHYFPETYDYDYTSFNCPCCGEELTSDEYHQPKFCPNCGQKLDWRENNG